jgi:hypothetical protein
VARHRRSVGLFVRRRTYITLWRRYQELEGAYRLLAGELDTALDDTVETPLPAPRHVPSWAVTEEIPVITTAGLDTDKADALVRRGGLLDGPAGSWS